MFQVAFPHYFWGEAILHATYLINKLPTPVLNWSSLHEKLYSQKPNLSLIKVFGCLAYVTNVQLHKNKLDPRASKCIYLGVATSQKGFKVFNLKTKTLFSSRDVVCYEEVFTFTSSLEDLSSIPDPS